MREPHCNIPHEAWRSDNTCADADAPAPCTLLPGAGLHTAASAYWDTTTDGSHTVRPRPPAARPPALRVARRLFRHQSTDHQQPADLPLSPTLLGTHPTPPFPANTQVKWENGSMCAIVTVFALSL